MLDGRAPDVGHRGRRGEQGTLGRSFDQEKFMKRDFQKLNVSSVLTHI